MEKLEEMQRRAVRQKDASETEGEGLQNGNIGYNEVTRKID